MHDTYQGVEKTVEQLPFLLGRLKSLKTVHEEDAKIINKIRSLKESQSGVLKSIKENSTVLQKVYF